MWPNPGAAARSRQPIMVAAMVVGFVLTMSGVARAEHHPAVGTDPGDIAALIAEVAEADQRLHDLGAAIQEQQEGVNKAIVDVQAARDRAAAAARDVEAGNRALNEANAAITAAQRRFDEVAAASYANGPPGGYLTGSSPEEMIAAAVAGQTLSLGFRQALTDLRRVRTEGANRESSARAARDRADQAVRGAQRSLAAATATLVATQRNFGAQQAEVDQLAARRDAAQARLDSARRSAAPAPRDRGEQAPTAGVAPPATPGQWDTTLPMVPSANVAGDPVAIINAVLRISATSAQVTADLGRKFLAGLGINLGGGPGAADPGFTNGRIPRVYGRQASEYVIRRAGSQIGVPYSWGGGNANGPSRGIDQGANTIGFDCSGLMLYAFAGVGIKLAHYSGDQYNAGRKVPSAQMRRGDLIFYGPNASQHEAMYLGNGMMLEAPYTGAQVRVAPVRTSGMMPYVTRLIEY